MNSKENQTVFNKIVDIKRKLLGVKGQPYTNAQLTIRSLIWLMLGLTAILTFLALLLKYPFQMLVITVVISIIGFSLFMISIAYVLIREKIEASNAIKMMEASNSNVSD